jgi:hypothetical protein
LYGGLSPSSDVDKDFDYGVEQILSKLLLRTFLVITPMDPSSCSSTTDEEETSPKPNMGLASRFAQPGDVITVLLGCSTPIILRPAGTQFKVIGDVYLYGFMSGEAVRGLGDDTNGLEDFYLS